MKENKLTIKCWEMFLKSYICLTNKQNHQPTKNPTMLITSIRKILTNIAKSSNKLEIHEVCNKITRLKSNTWNTKYFSLTYCSEIDRQDLLIHIYKKFHRLKDLWALHCRVFSSLNTCSLVNKWTARKWSEQMTSMGSSIGLSL